MIVTLNDKEIEIKQLTISQYEYLQGKGDKLTDIEIITLFTELTEEQIKDVPHNQVKFVSDMIQTWAVKSIENEPLPLTLEYKGQKLGLIQPATMTYGEFSDLHILLEQKPVDYRRVCAILYRPLVSGNGEERVIDKYNFNECDVRRNDMDDFPVAYYISALFFLTKFNQELLETSPLYMASKKQTELINQMKEQMPKN